MVKIQNKKTILIAEDDPVVVDLYKDELEKGGYHVLTAKDGVEALEMLRKNLVDLLLLDIMMPEKSGLDVLSEMKADPKTASIPVFILSVLGAADDRARGLALGAARYIAKVETIPGKVIQEVEDFFKS